METKRKKYIWAIVITCLIILYIVFTPRSYVSMKDLAIDEFKDWIFENHEDPKYYSGPSLISGFSIKDTSSRFNDYLIFEWNAVIDGDTFKLRVYTASYIYQETSVSGTYTGKAYENMWKIQKKRYSY